MKIAVLSGKGGTGKTLVAVNLAAVAKYSIYADCDVEEPNGHLFFKPTQIESEKICIKLPVVQEELCDGCKKCVEFCKFNALAYVNKKLLLFDDVCHSCGGCLLVCPQKALKEREKIVGEIQNGFSQGVEVITGMLNTGEASGIPIINKIFAKIKSKNKVTFVDCPPGSACIVMESIKDSDYCILVAEPTLFGVHNLSMVYELVKLFEKPCGVILNKCIGGENPSEEFCKENNIKILGSISYDKELGTLNSNALIAARESEKYEKMFFSLYKNVLEEVQNETTLNS